MVYNGVTQKFLLHQTSGAGAPADWQYDPAADTWTKLASGGVPPARNMAMGFDPVQKKLVGWYRGAGAILWQGQFGSGTTVVSGSPASLSLVSGNGQMGIVGQALAAPFAVKVADSNGIAVSGINVTFTVTAGGGTLSKTSVSTDSNGLASSTLTLGSTAGTNTVTAASGTLAGSPVSFTATGALPAPAATLLLVSGNSQTGAVNQALQFPLTVKAVDANSNPVPGTTVTFTVQGGGGSLSATSVLTNSSGLASAALTLGPAAGTNTVTAASGTLAGSPITFTATGVMVATSAVTVSWSQAGNTTGWPGGNGGIVLPYDPVSGQSIYYGHPPGAANSYSSDIYFYKSATNTWTHVNGTGSMTSTCNADTLTQPGERTPYGKMAIDTRRNFLWIYGGACAGVIRQDTYYMTLNADPMQDVWHQVSTAHFPVAAGYSSMVYDPDDDILFAYGYDGGSSTYNQWIYCRTAENPTPGVPTTKQVAAGCINGDDWNEVNHGQAPLSASILVGLIYDPVDKKVVLYGGTTSGGVQSNETWIYDVPAHGWTKKCQGGCIPPPVSADGIPLPALVYNPVTQRVLLHQTTGAGAPADWQYDPSADVWTKLTTAGTVPSSNIAVAFDSTQNKLIGFSQGSSALVWLGALSSNTPNACDLNGDGLVTFIDVQLAIAQALGTASCGTADVNGDGRCDVIDVQLIINASLSGVCQVGQ